MQDNHWLNRERLRVYPRIFAAVFLVIIIALVMSSKNMIDMKGKPLGFDFITFWGASYEGLSGHAADAYNIPSIFKAEQIAVPAGKNPYAWYYPPTFFLLVLPLALLPYLVSYFAFMAATFAGYITALRRIFREKEALWCIAAFPGTLINIFHGQNAFLTAALAGAALLCLESQPVLAGVFIGLLAIKPQLGLLFPVALIAVGAWRTFFVAGIVAIIFAAAGIAVLGADTIPAWLHSLTFARSFLESGTLPWITMPSTFVFFSMLGTPPLMAYMAQAFAAAAAAMAVWYVWRRSSDVALRGAILMTASLMTSPYLFDYDLAWLAFPIAWLALAGLRDGWRKGERELLFIAWLLPLLISPVGKITSIQIGPLVLGALMWVVIKRCRSLR